MTQAKIEELVAKALADSGSKLGRICAVDHMINKAGTWGVLISDSKGFFALSLNTQTHGNEAHMDAEVRRQIALHRPV